MAEEEEEKAPNAKCERTKDGWREGGREAGSLMSPLRLATTTKALLITATEADGQTEGEDETGGYSIRIQE